jgi:PAS domain S-box-containing protein
MRVQTKLISLLLFLSAIFVAVWYCYKSFEGKRIYLLFKQSTEEKSVYFDKLIKLKGASLEALAFDYTYWDEMVDFILNKDMEWAKKTIDVNVLKTYQADAIWIYRRDFSPVYSINNQSASSLKELPLSKENISSIFLQKPFSHFFVNTNAGLLEIRGATVHPTSDPERKTPAQGYFFVGRLWGKAYIQELEGLIGGEINITTAKQRMLSSLGDSSIIFSKEVTDWRGKPVAYINVTIKSQELPIYRFLSRNAAVIFFVFLLFVIIFIAASLSNTVSLPLGIISQALREKDPTVLQSLEKKTSEFGAISRLISKFFKQREELVEEISERKRIEETLRQNENYLMTIFNFVQTGVMIVDAETHRIVDVNPVVVRLFGAPREQIVDMLCYKFICPAEKGECPITDLHQEVDNSECVLLRSNGESFPVLKTVVPIRLRNRMFLLESFIDITVRKKAEEELKKAYTKLQETQDQLIQAEKLNAVGKLASGVAHEVRNPLSIILQGINYLEEKITPRDKDVSETIATLKESIERADKIINGLLDFSRVTSLDLKPQDVNSILETSFSLAKVRLRLDNIDTIIETKKDIPLVLADKNKLEQVFINLLLNAVQAMPNGGKIIIRSYDKQLGEIKNGIGRRQEDNFRLGERAVIVEIEDTGTGILEENLKKVFDPFFTTKSPRVGVGLGLSVTKNIISMHKGLIGIESQANKGTKVTVTLKIAQQ